MTWTARLLDCEGVTWNEQALSGEPPGYLPVAVMRRVNCTVNEMSENPFEVKLPSTAIVLFWRERLIPHAGLAIYRCWEAFA